MFKDFELPFLPTVLIGFVMLLAVVVVVEVPTDPVDAMHTMARYDAELIGNVVHVHRDSVTGIESASILFLADKVWKARHEYDPKKELEISIKGRVE